MVKNGITFALTSCGRFNELKITIDSFFKYNTQKIDRYIIIEDSGENGIKEKCLELNKQYNNIFEFIFNQEQIGQISSIDLLYSTINTEYIFHCEDDWEFYEKGFIEKSLQILKNDQKILQVWLRELDDTNGHTVDPEIYNVDNIEYKTVNTNWREGWGGFSFNPGLRRLKEYNMLKPYANINLKLNKNQFYTPELDLSKDYAQLGYKAAILTKGSVKHIGWGKTIM